MHSLITGITGLAPELVRPRWQKETATVPGPDISWCAFGLTRLKVLKHPEIMHFPQDQGRDELISHEELSFLLSFYGPEGVDLALIFNDGLYVAQNRVLLRRNDMAFVKTGDIVNVPESPAMNWQSRADLVLVLSRESRRAYAALNLLQCGSCGSVLESDSGIVVPLGCCAEADREQEPVSGP